MKIHPMIGVFIVCFLSGLFSSRARGAEALIVPLGFKGVALYKHLTYAGSSFGDNTRIFRPSYERTTERHFLFHDSNETIYHTLTIDNPQPSAINLVLFSDLPLSLIRIKRQNSIDQESYGGRYYSAEQVPTSIIPATLVHIPPGISTFEIATSKFSNIGPAQLFIWSEPDFLLYEKESLIYISLVFGGVASLFLYNIFLLSVNKSILTVYFTITCFCFGIFEAIISGATSIFSYQIFDFSSRLWPLFATLSSSFFSLFLAEINPSTSQKRIKIYSTLVSIACNGISLIFVLFSEHIHYMYQIFTIFFLVVLNGLMPWILSRFKFREHLVLLSSVPLVFASMMLVLQISSLIDSDLSFARVQQTTGIIFLLFLSIYTGNKTHQDRFSKAKLQEMITLGRSVQDLLLPKRLEETFKSLSYAFAYEPFEGNMSGDWIKYWKTNDGRHHFLLGDVTGKGPQAALAVSIISTVVDRCIRLDNDAKSALIQINRTLFSLLKGSVGSTASGASIGQNRELKLFNTAGIGWILQDAKTVRHILGRSSILGQKNLVEISECTVKEHQWTLIYTFSDGVCNGPRAIKHLTRRLLDLNVNPLKSQDLKQEVLKIANYIGDPQDDKTLLIIKLGLADAA